MLTQAQRIVRQNVRNHACGLTREEVVKEIEMSVTLNDSFRAECYQEWLNELDAEERRAESK